METATGEQTRITVQEMRIRLGLDVPKDPGEETPRQPVGDCWTPEGEPTVLAKMRAEWSEVVEGWTCALCPGKVFTATRREAARHHDDVHPVETAEWRRAMGKFYRGPKPRKPSPVTVLRTEVAALRRENEALRKRLGEAVTRNS